LSGLLQSFHEFSISGKGIRFLKMNLRQQLRTDWKNVIPGVALVIQVAFDNFFNGAFPKAATSTSATSTMEIGTGPQCTSHLELILRTIAFGITATVGVGFMKLTCDKWWCFLQLFSNAVFVFCWLFAISDYPLTCWINSDGALTTYQLRFVSGFKLGLTAISAIFGVIFSLQANHRTFCQKYLNQMGTCPIEDDPDNFRTIWQKVIPGVAIVLQFVFDSFFNLVFPKSKNTSSTATDIGSGPHCTGKKELISRSVFFVITAVVGLIFMKWKFKEDKDWPWQKKWFHCIMNFCFVFSWLFAISDFPLTCWINSNGALTADQLIIVSFVKFFWSQSL
jgi:hypothetical protein